MSIRASSGFIRNRTRSVQCSLHGVALRNDEEFGWLPFAGEMEENEGLVNVRRTDTVPSRVCLADLEPWLTRDAERFERSELALSYFRPV